MKTLAELQGLVHRFDEVCHDWVDDRFSSSIEWGGGMNRVNSMTWSESWSIDFIDDFFQFEVSKDTFEEAITETYQILEGYLKQVETRNITATYLVRMDFSEKKTLRPFSIDDCRTWNHYGMKRECFPTEAEALKELKELNALGKG